MYKTFHDKQTCAISHSGGLLHLVSWDIRRSFLLKQGKARRLEMYSNFFLYLYTL